MLPWAQAASQGLVLFPVRMGIVDSFDSEPMFLLERRVHLDALWDQGVADAFVPDSSKWAATASVPAWSNTPLEYG